MNEEQKEFVNSHHLAILSTCDDHQPHGAAIYYDFEEEGDKFYFVTKSGTQKTENLVKNPKVALTIIDENNLSIMHIEGEARIFDGNMEEKIKHLNHLNEIHNSRNFLATPVSKIKDGVMVLVEIKIKDYKFFNFSMAEKDEKES